MVEVYKAYQICTGWDDKGWGYDFRVYDDSRKEIFTSQMPYFYEENAVNAAKEEIDRKLSERK